MLLLPIETDVSFFQPSRPIPSGIRKFVLPASLARYTHSSEGAILDMNIRLPGFSIWIHYLWMKNKAILHPFSTRNTWALHYWLADKIPVTLRDRGAMTLEDCMLFYLTKNEHTAWPSFGDALSVHINIDPEQILTIVNELPALKGLEQLPSPLNNTLINPVPFAINPVTRTLLKRILHCRYTGHIAMIYQRRNCIDLYLQYLDQLAAPPAVTLISPRLKKTLYEIQRMIILHPEKPEKLTDTYGIPEHTLRDAFRQEFHISLFDYIMMEKLNKAFHMLMHNGVSRTQIAKELGYPHEAFLNGDFKLRYGNTK